MRCGRRVSRASICLQRPTVSGARSGAQRREDARKGDHHEPRRYFAGNRQGSQGPAVENRERQDSVFEARRDAQHRHMEHPGVRQEGAQRGGDSLHRRDPGRIRSHQHCGIARQPDRSGPRPRGARADLAGHAQWGTPAGRLVELQSLAEWIDLKRNEKTSEDKDLIIVGDFNIETPEQLAALTGKGLQMPAALKGKSFGTNLAQDKRYDQILHYPGYPENFSNQAGVVDFYAGSLKELFPGMDKSAFTFQMSDHLPLWMQINTNIEGQKLDEIICAGK